MACVKHHFPDATIVDDRVQTWGSNDRKGTLDTVYEYQNPYTRQTEYFSLQGLGSDGRYWYFPTDKTNNRFWVYLGTDKNEALAANGRIAALQSWGANDRKAAIGDRFRYLNPHKPGLPMEVYELRATGSDGRYWYFPTTSSANTYWTYVGPAVTSAGSR